MSKPRKTKKPAANIVWFEIPADDLKRARNFYSKLFGWKLNKFPMPMEYWHIDTGGPDASPDGGLMERQDPRQSITNFIMVESVDKSAAKVIKLGGKICLSKRPVPKMGWFVVCLDTENNSFALWQMDPKAA